MNQFTEGGARRRTSAPANLRVAQKDETKRRILEVARKSFERHGFEESNFRDIANVAGVAVGTVALHFEDKTGLLHAALFDDLEEAIELCLTRGNRGSLANRIAEIMQPAYEYYGRRPQLSRTLLASALFAASPWKERFAGQAQRIQVRLVAVIEGARSRAEITSDVDVAMFVASIFSFFYMALIGWANGQVEDPLVLFRLMVNQHVQGVLPTSRRTRVKR